MTRVKPTVLIAFSIAWIAYILSDSVETHYLMNFELLRKEIDMRNFIEYGLVPVIYMWMFFIFTRFLTGSKKALKKH